MSKKRVKKKIRILHVAQAAGGVDRYIRMLLRYLDKEKFENILVCSYDFKPENYTGRADGFEQIAMQRAIGGADFKAVLEVRKRIKQYQPDIVYAHSSKAGVIARLANIGGRAVCIYNPHGWAFHMRCGRQKQRLYTIIERIAAPFCKRIVCISNAERDSALEMKICGPQKLRVIFNGIDIAQYEVRKESGIAGVTREALQIPENAFVVGMVGRISKQKAPDIFIRAAKLIKETIPNSFFMIVGDGELRDEVRQYAKEHGLEKSLCITGWVENAPDYVDLFDVAMLLSRWEGFGLALPEYMLADKPVVAANVDAIPNIIQNGENGLLVNVDDAKEAAGAVRRLHDDAALRMRLVQNAARDVREKYDIKRVAREHEEMFLELVRGKGNTP